MQKAASFRVPVCEKCGPIWCFARGSRARGRVKFWGCSNFPACRYTKTTKRKSYENLKLTISYDGSRYYGWERQPGRDTIQGKLEAVLSRMVNAEVNVIGAGRTDAGVHARAMVANCYLETDMQPDEIRGYMNRYLPDDICVDEVKFAADRFHARYRAVGKLYTYTCYVGDTKPVFNRKYVTTLDYVPDVAAMQRAAEVLTGEHDFKASAPIRR